MPPIEPAGSTPIAVIRHPPAQSLKTAFDTQVDRATVLYATPYPNATGTLGSVLGFNAVRASRERDAAAHLQYLTRRGDDCLAARLARAAEGDASDRAPR